MDNTPWLTDDEQTLWRTWLRVGRGIDAALAQQLAADHGLSMPDYVVLVNLTETEEGRLRASELADRLGWERSRLSHHISRMETRGLVERVSCPSDKRGAFVVVTPKGRDAIAEAAPGHVRAVRRALFDRLDEDDRAQLARLLGKLDVDRS